MYNNLSCAFTVERKPTALGVDLHKRINIILVFFSSLLDKLKDSPVADLAAHSEKQIENKNTLLVILADDDSDDRELFEEALAEIDSKISLHLAEDGMQLLEILNTLPTRPDIIFLDLNMPVKSGKQCLIEIKNHNKFKDIPVVIYSTSANSKDINDTWSTGANFYVRKPNNFNGLISIVKKILSLDLEEFKLIPAKNMFLINADTL